MAECTCYFILLVAWDEWARQPNNSYTVSSENLGHRTQETKQGVQHLLSGKWLRVCNNFGKFVSALAQRNPLMLLITADDHSQECRIISNSSWHVISPKEFKKQNQGVQFVVWEMAQSV